MHNKHPKIWTGNRTEGDALDRALDAELEKYSAVEPRAGLEQRILAGLQSERDRMPALAWWRSRTVGVVATVVVIVLALAWRLSRPANILVQQHSAPVETIAPANQIAARGETATVSRVHEKHKGTRHQVHPSVATAAPKLDQFPSPRPLTREELALVQYVKDFPRDAVTIASAQEEFEREIQQESLAGSQAKPDSTKEER